MKSFDGKKIPGGSQVSPKLDGVYAKATKDGLFSKSGNRISTQPHLERRLRLHFKLRPKSQLEGELYRHGQPFEKTLSDFKGNRKLQYHLFPAQKGKPLPVLGIRHVKAQKVKSQAQADAHLKRSIQSGYEGQIVRDPAGNLQKRKPFHDEEFRVVQTGRGKKNDVLTVQNEGGHPFRVAAPAGTSSEDSVGKLVTVKYHNKSTKGIPRSPVFKAIRDYDMSSLRPGMIEFGSGGMMRQARILASISRENSSAHFPAAFAAAKRLDSRVAAAATRVSISGNKEKRDLFRATVEKTKAYLARLGLKKSF